MFSLLLSAILCGAPLPGHYVGELQESWTFPSDHLPVGGTVDGIHIATWNVLNRAYMGWMVKNTQGLSRSAIVAEDKVIVSESGLNLREERVIQDILLMIDHPTHPRSLISLQECGEIFLKELQSRLPERFDIVFSSPIPVRDQNVILYDTDKFVFVQAESKIVHDAFPCEMGRSLMDVLFVSKATGVNYRVINTHAPGDPAKPGRDEFARYIAKHRQEGQVMLAMGDINFDVPLMEKAFQDAGIDDFTDLVSYYTIVGTDKFARAIDHIYVNAPNCKANSPEEVLPALQATLDLLAK